MATIDDLNLTPYQRIMARMTPAMNPYMGAGQIMGGYDPSFQGGYDPGLYSRLNRSGLINTGGGGGGGDSGGGDFGGGAQQPGRSGPNVSFGPDNFMVANNVNPNIVGGITGLLGLIAGFPGLGFVGRELANRSNFTNDQAAMFGNVGLRDTTDPSNLSGLIGQTATTGPTGTGGQASSAAASAAAAASAMGYSNEAIAAASQAAANAAISGASAADAALAASMAAAAVASDIDAISASEGISADQTGSPPGELGSTSVTADADNSGNTGGGGGAGGGTDYGSSGFGDYFKGGLVDRVGGPNPAGPDDGAGMLQLGEYVVKKSAVNKYGKGLLDMINDGKIPAKKLKSLLG